MPPTGLNLNIIEHLCCGTIAQEWIGAAPCHSVGLHILSSLLYWLFVREPKRNQMLLFRELVHNSTAQRLQVSATCKRYVVEKLGMPTEKKKQTWTYYVLNTRFKVRHSYSTGQQPLQTHFSRFSLNCKFWKARVKALLAACSIWCIRLSLSQQIKIGNPIWVWVKIRYPNNWMVHTTLD